MALRAALLALALVSNASAASPPSWRSGAPLPVARTEVSAAVSGREIVVAGGFVPDGSSSREVDLYATRANTWRRGPDLPVAVNHAMAATVGGKVYLVGGYGASGPLRSAFVLDGGRWRALPPMPAARAAGGAAALGGRLYVVGGVGPGGLARNTFVFDPAHRRWSSRSGPTPREHLAVAGAAGRIYAIAGRTAGYDTNLTLVESWRPGQRTWQRLAPIPEARGGTGAATVGATIVSVGGEAPQGTIRSVWAYSTARRSWTQLADLPTPRHGLGVVAVGKVVYAIGGGPEPGLHVSAANEVLSLP
jgi:N-acetylneuraminic acid mutarotase